jgi:hypothetical protein
MIGVDDDVFLAACRFGIVARAGGKPRRRATGDMSRHGSGSLLEFADADGGVIARKVTALGESQCWLRADLAEAADAALAREAEDYARVTAELRDFIHATDRQGAARNGVSVEQYRAKRHAAGNQWDRYRAKQRAGGY